MPRLQDVSTMLTLIRNMGVQVEQGADGTVHINAGPLNSHHLVHRALLLMRELSPEYLNRFMSYVDSLLWIDQANGSMAAAAAASERCASSGISTWRKITGCPPMFLPDNLPSSASASRRRARSTSASPTPEGRTSPRLRTSRGAPMWASRSAMCRLTVGGARCSVRAASAKDPRSAMVTRVQGAQPVEIEFAHDVQQN